MRFRPLHDFCFVERDEAEDETKTPGGLVIPKKGQRAPDTATVLAIGPGRVLDDGTLLIPDVKPGDKIALTRHSGMDINWGVGGSERRTVISSADILGIVEFEPGDKTQDPVSPVSTDD